MTWVTRNGVYVGIAWWEVAGQVCVCHIAQVYYRFLVIRFLVISRVVSVCVVVVNLVGVDYGSLGEVLQDTTSGHAPEEVI